MAVADTGENLIKHLTLHDPHAPESILPAKT
jgi:hypothetical protein